MHTGRPSCEDGGRDWGDASFPRNTKGGQKMPEARREA